jgi:uncharacterized protein (TIGR02001 family)
MQKKLIGLAMAAALSVPGPSSAQQTAPAAAPASAHTFTGNITLISDYRFRGISQTYGKPALQGGFDYSHASGFYLGNWNSNVSQGAGFPGGNLEMDFYGGYKAAFGDLGVDIGAIYYYYPGTNSGVGIPFSPTNNRTGAVASGRVDNKELYIGGSWKWLSLKYYHAIDDYFSTPGTKNTGYWDLSANYDLGSGWGVLGHVGRLKFKNMNNANYTDWKLGVTKDIAGWVFGASYVDTNAKGDCGSGQFYCFGNTNNTATKDAGKGALLLSVGKTF